MNAFLVAIGVLAVVIVVLAVVIVVVIVSRVLRACVKCGARRELRRLLDDTHICNTCYRRHYERRSP